MTVYGKIEGKNSEEVPKRDEKLRKREIVFSDFFIRSVSDWQKGVEERRKDADWMRNV